MMSKNQESDRNQIEMITIDELVPKDHLVRKLDSSIDFSFIYPLVEPLYSTLGRPSVDPVILIKMTFVQYVFGIRSMRQTIKEIQTNMAYRWFLGFGFRSLPIGLGKLQKRPEKGYWKSTPDKNNPNTTENISK